MPAIAKSSESKGKAKIEKVMHEMKEGTLRSGSGQKVTNPKQAVAIALSEAQPDDLVLVTGSLYVVGAARAALHVPRT